MTIDWWTLGFQTVNVGVLIWLLGRFFWRPGRGDDRAAPRFGRADPRRRRGARGRKRTPRSPRSRTRAPDSQGNAKRSSPRRGTRRSGRRRRAATRPPKQAAAIEAAGRAAIESERQAAERAWAERAAQLAVEIAERLAARLDGEAVRAAFLDWLVAAIRALPDEKRQVAATDGGALEAISATPIDPAEQERARKRIAEALGTEPSIAFTTDPSLIAGLELSGPHLVVSNSWRADLNRILADIAHDEGR